MPWLEHADRLLYAGEREERRVAVGDATILVTTHRVLVFTPGDRPRFHEVARPNVGRVEVVSSGRLEYLLRAALLAVVASVAVVIAALFTFRDLVPGVDDADGESGVDGAPGADVAGETLGLVETLFLLVDVAVLSTAILTGLAACWYAARYVTSRDRRLVLEVYGDDDVEIPVDTVGVAAIELQNAIDPDHELSGASPATPVETPDVGRSADALEPDGEPAYQSVSEAGSDPTVDQPVDAYGIRAPAGRDSAGSPSRPSTGSSHHRSESTDPDAAVDTGADAPGSFVFGAETDESRADLTGVDEPFDDPLESPPASPDVEGDDGVDGTEPIDPFDDPDDSSDDPDPFDDPDDSSDDPDPFDDADREHAGPSDDLEWGISAATPDWAVDDREQDDPLESGTAFGSRSDSGLETGERDDEVIDLREAGSADRDGSRRVDAGSVADDSTGDGAPIDDEPTTAESVADDDQGTVESSADDDPATTESLTDADSNDSGQSDVDADVNDPASTDVDGDDRGDAGDPAEADDGDDPIVR